MSYYYKMEVNQDRKNRNIIFYLEDSIASLDFQFELKPNGKIVDISYSEGNESLEPIEMEITNLFEYMENKLRELDESAEEIYRGKL